MDTADVLTAVDAIDGGFAARQHPDAFGVSVGDDMVVVRGRAYVLNPTAALVWQCFDGEGTIDEIVADLADATGAPVEVIHRDVLGLTRELAETGLLDGIALLPPAADIPAWTAPQGLQIGEQMATFTLPDLDGTRVALEGFRGRRLLLVNWSPGCGFCHKIAGELGELEAALDQRGITLAFVTDGTVEANRALLDEAGIKALALLKEDGVDPFPGFGTPAAYLVDADGNVAAPMAYGADEVPVLARDLSGIERPGTALEPPTRARYLPAAAAVCGGGDGGAAPARGTDWEGTRAYRVGSFHVGIRFNTDATAGTLDRLLPGLSVEDGRAPDNYSVALYPATGRSRELNLLVRGSAQLVRSRSAARVLHAMLAYLSVDVGERDPSLVHLAATAAVRDGTAILLPPGLIAWVKEIQPRLARAGVQLVDLPWSALDPTSGELVVAEPVVEHDAGLLEEVDAGVKLGSELPWIRPGRYPLGHWFTTAPGEPGETLTAAVTVGAGVPQLLCSASELPEAVEALAQLAARTPAQVIGLESPESFAEQLGSLLR